MDESAAKLIAGLFTEMAAIREVLVQSTATRARQSGDPDNFCRQLSQGIRADTDTDVQTIVLQKIDDIIAQILRVAKK